MNRRPFPLTEISPLARRWTASACTAAQLSLIALLAAGCPDADEAPGETELMDACVFVLVTHPTTQDQELLTALQVELGRCGSTTDTEILCRATSPSVDACTEQFLPRLDDLLRDRPGVTAICVEDCND